MIKFPKLVICTSLLIAGCAAYFSVYGIGLLFSGAIVSTMIMATSLELGKLVTTAWLFRYWDKSNILLRIYMILAVIALMGITSLGIFGFLTAAFQKSSLENELSNNKIITLESQKTLEFQKIEGNKQTVSNIFKLRSLQENRLTDVLTNALIARNPIQLQSIQNQITEQIDTLNNQLESESLKLKSYEQKALLLEDGIFKLKTDNSQKKDITTFKFVADEFNTTIQKVVKWFIVVLITVFDPLAIVLLLAYNITNIKSETINNDSGSFKNDYSPDISSDVNVGNVDKINKLSILPIKDLSYKMDSEKIIIEREIPVEKIVERIVEKEVPVEKIVEKIVERIVEKEVPVEKIVVKRMSSDSGRPMFSF